MYIQKYLDLTNKIGDKKGETVALQYMGMVNASEGCQTEGLKQFEKSFELAENMNDKKIEYISKCSYGMANAELKIDDYLKDLVSTSKKLANDETNKLK